MEKILKPKAGLKAKLPAAQSAEKAAALVKADGQELTLRDAAQLLKEIQKGWEQDGKELSLDELETVSGGADRDWLKEGCAATVEAGSWCGTNDSCVWIDVQYDHPPVKDPCPQCGGQMYMDRVEYESKGNAYYYRKCLRCGCVQKSRK